MGAQMIFQRYEIKYLLTAAQKEAVLCAMRNRMQLDQYGRATIRNVYLDTDNYRLIRRSLEKPAYKEKLRIRSYQQAQANDPVFVGTEEEIQICGVQKTDFSAASAVIESFQQNRPLPVASQIGNEIEYVRQYYGSLHPTVFLSYEREAYFPVDGGNFRVTFDENILYRQKDLSLGSKVYGLPLLQPGQTLLELKPTVQFRYG